VTKLEANGDTITAEVLELCSTRNTIVRTMDIYNPYVRTDIVSDTWQNDGGMNDFQVFKIYVDEVNYHILPPLTQRAYPTPR
jgi:hypothetical protein